jgi:hypothetical protein
MTEVISGHNVCDMYYGGIKMYSAGVQFESRRVPLIVLIAVVCGFPSTV